MSKVEPATCYVIALAASMAAVMLAVLFIMRARPVLAFVVSWVGVGASVAINGLLLTSDVNPVSRSCFQFVILIAVLATAICGIHAFCINVPCCSAIDEGVELGISVEYAPQPFVIVPLFLATRQHVAAQYGRCAAWLGRMTAKPRHGVPAWSR